MGEKPPSMSVISKQLYFLIFRLDNYMKSRVLCDITSYSQLKVNLCSSEMSIGFQWSTQHYIQEDRMLQNHHCENVKFLIVICFRTFFG
jgi:hypothetical protein